MSLSTTLPSNDPSYTAPIYNTPKSKQLRTSLSKKTTAPQEQEDPQVIMQQYHELMQKIQRERQEINALQEEADEKQATYDKKSFSPELKKLMDQVNDLKDEKQDLDNDLARIREKYTPEMQADINNEVANLRRDFFFDTESLEQIYDNISKMKNKSKDFYNQEPAKSILEAEKRITELTHKKNDLYRESAQIDVDFEEIFNPQDGAPKENRKVKYLERKLKLIQDEAEKKNQILQQMEKDQEKAKDSIMQKREEEERKKKLRAEMSKSRRREMLAQQCKAAGYELEPEENKDDETKSKKTEDDVDLEKMLGLDYEWLNQQKHRSKKKKAAKKKKSTTKQTTENTPTSNTNENKSKSANTNTNTTTKNATKKSTKKSKTTTVNSKEKSAKNNGEDNIFENAEEKNVNEKKKGDVEIDDEKDLVNIGQADSDSEVQIIGDNDTGELSHKAIDSLLKSKDENNTNENEEEKEKTTDDKENVNKDQDDDEYDYFDCIFSQITLLDVSPESFSKSSAGNFSSMLSSGLGLLNNDKDSKKQNGKIKVYKNNKNERELTQWNSNDVENSEENADNDQSSVSILPLYDFEYSQDWKIVSKTLKSGTQALDSLLKSQDQTDNQQSEDQTDSKAETEEEKQENSKKTTKSKSKNKEIKESSENKENDENDEESKNLSSVIDDTKSLFNKTDKTGDEENNENKEDETNDESKEVTNKTNEKEESKNENEDEENKKDNENVNDKSVKDGENKNDEKENENENVKNEENENEDAKNEKNENENDELNVKDPNEIDDKLEMDGVCGTSPNRGDVQEEEKKVFEITVLVDGFLREDRPSENETFDSMVLLDISPSPLFAKLSDAFKRKGIVSAGKFNYDI